MEQIRQRAHEGLMAAPRVGMGVGGLLLGVRDDSRIRLLDSIDLPCSYRNGPSFSLTPGEKQESRELVAEANLLSASSKVGVIGWYCSKTRGDATLSQSDLGLFAELFPGAGQVALVLRPDVTEPMRAAFFFRNENGAVVKGLECDIDEWRSAPNAEPAESDSLPEIAAAEEPVAVQPEPPRVIEIRQAPPQPEEPVKAAAAAATAETTLADIIALSPDDAPVARPAWTRSPMFGTLAMVAPEPRPPGKLRLALLTVAAVLALGVAAYFTEDFWLPRPPLHLTFTQLDGSLLIRWDPEALRGIDHASMYVNDGGQPVPAVIPLDRFQLTSGQLSYTPKSGRVTAKLDAGKTNAFNSWVAPPESKPGDSKSEEQKPVAAAPDSPAQQSAQPLSGK